MSAVPPELEFLPLRFFPARMAAVRAFVLFHRSSGGLTQDSEPFKMFPRPLKLLIGQCQRFIDGVAVSAHHYRVSFKQFFPFFAGHVQV